MKDLIVTLTGPSCAGKTTLESRMEATGFGRVMSHTTRSPRPGEVPGAAYTFVDKTRFEQLVKMGQFVETVEFDGNMYGSTRADVAQALDRGEGRAVWVLEPNGQKQVTAWAAKQHGLTLLRLFIDSPPLLIAMRFLERALVEFNRHVLADDAALAGESVLKSAARLSTMLTTEHEWRQEATNPESTPYDIMISHFAADTEEQVMEFIGNFVRRQAGRDEVAERATRAASVGKRAQ